MESYRYYAGIDWADEKHSVWLRDAETGQTSEKVFDHSAKGLRALIDWMSEWVSGRTSEVGIAIEVTRGAIVEALLERGFAVFAINPKQLDRFRDRHTVAGAKDDRRDAFVLGHSLSTDMKAFRRLRIEDPAIIRLRELARLSEDLKQDRRRLTNRLRAQLHRFFPQVLQLCSGADEAWLWDLIDRVVVPGRAARVGRRLVEGVLRDHGIRRHSTDDVIEVLKTPPLPVAPGAAEAAREHIAVLLPRLRVTEEQLHQVEKRLERLLTEMQETEAEKGEHRDVEIIRSWAGIGKVVAATMLTGVGASCPSRLPFAPGPVWRGPGDQTER